ncbi:cation tolerance protein CutA [Mycobacterium sp. ACS1612]|uniref:FAD-dependent oxidoreductase n=1 Tax=Mycobacterium sp. ACS1612 TaxID=1834117 RepID=UPI000800E063|nr:FAD-dependent oxidoreductase [Mycobacterium sp. ACS1612]OBF29337.1 cation tolerance protein CutA [Mycobacterium sp. ACS1612]
MSGKSEARRFLAKEILDSSDPHVRESEAFPSLTADQVERVSGFGVVEQLQRGAVLYEPGDRAADFFLVLDGFIEIYVSRTSMQEVVHTYGQQQFTGELNLFNDRATLVGGRMGCDGCVARLNGAQFRRLLAAEPDIANVVMRAFILRRERIIVLGHTAVTIIAPRDSAKSLQLKRFLDRNRQPYLLADPAVESEAAAQLLALGLDNGDTPVVLCGDDRVLVCPTPRELGDSIGISEALAPEHVADVVVVGAGPAGLAAAVYSASEGLDTVVLEADAPGGQASTSSRIENYLGFPIGISGRDLAHRAQVQAQKFGARIIVPRAVVRLVTDSRPYVLELDDGTQVRAHTIVVATGARYRSLPLPNIAQFEGCGVHYAATAVESELCQGDDAAVVGGGNSAGQAAVYLSRLANHVHILVRGDGLTSSMSDYLIRRIEAAPERITVHPHAEVTALSGERHLDTVTWRDRDTGQSQTRHIPNVFLMLGASPNTEWLNCVALDENGFVQTGIAAASDDPATSHALSQPLATSCPGIFAVGDVRSGSIKRVASAVGEGSIVVASVHQALEVS